jgi:hypothetical protein
MIIVLFPAGAFGSTVEYSLRQFSNELPKVVATVGDDGSMHSYNKEFHPITIKQFQKIKDSNYKIVTPVYPGHDYMSPAATLEEFKKNINLSQKVLLIHFTNLEQAQRNELFCYYKVPTFLDTIMKDKHQAWNINYSSYKDMQLFELREALSLYIDQKTEHLYIDKVIDENWLGITPDDLLCNFKNTILKIINYYELTVDFSQNIDEFYNAWFQKQQYILNEFKTIDNILINFKLDSDLVWDKLSVMGEAIVQSRLRQQGIEIACYNLNQFPTDIKSLKHITFKET